jgi:Tol biopolymer transport system component
MFPMPHRDLDEHFDHATYSPDGKKIAFYAEADGGAFSGIFVVGVDGKHRRMIIDGGSAPAWSPDGRTIAYDYYDFARKAESIGLAAADGKHRRRLVLSSPSRVPRLPRAPAEPAWSADGRRIVFTDDEQAIWIAHRDGTGARRIIAPRHVDRAWVSNPAWQPRRQ